MGSARGVSAVAGARAAGRVAALPASARERAFHQLQQARLQRQRAGPGARRSAPASPGGCHAVCLTWGLCQQGHLAKHIACGERLDGALLALQRGGAAQGTQGKRGRGTPSLGWQARTDARAPRRSAFTCARLELLA